MEQNFEKAVGERAIKIARFRFCLYKKTFHQTKRAKTFHFFREISLPPYYFNYSAFLVVFLAVVFLVSSLSSFFSSFLASNFAFSATKLIAFSD